MEKKVSDRNAMDFLNDMSTYSDDQKESLEKDMRAWLHAFLGYTYNIKPATPSPAEVYKGACALLGFTKQEKIQTLVKYYSVLMDNNYFYELNPKSSVDKVVIRMSIETIFLPHTELFMRHQLYTQALAQIELQKEIKRLRGVVKNE
tara:strand:+ start:140 stop:580 length:441 start_codon:yes stop_codon:yes gene_type:complete